MLNSKEKKILRFIKFFPILFVLLTSGITTTILIIDSSISFQKESDKLTETFMQLNKKRAKNEVHRVLEYINFERKNSNEPEEVIKQRVLKYANTIRYGDSGYIFIATYMGEMICHINDKVVGKNLYNHQDINNKYVMRDAIQQAQKGEGYITYVARLNQLKNIHAEKTSYVKGYDDWLWVIGTGFYKDELNASIQFKKEEIRQKRNRQIQHILIIGVLLTVILFVVTLYFANTVKLRFLKYRQKVDEEIANNIHKDNILAHQAKMAAMGEMIANISHQWKQPLNTITSMTSSIRLQKDFNQLNEDKLERYIDVTNDAAIYLSQTIDDFKDFFNPNKPKGRFVLSNTFEKAFKLSSAQCDQYDIAILTSYEECEVYSFENELLQVIINIINNAKDILVQRKIDKKLIEIKIKQKQNFAHIYITDNAGGIDEKVRPYIFDAYFSTKGDENGTGIGLYMSKEIIEKNMDGKLEVYNTQLEYKNKTYTGACFCIKLPLYMPDLND